jgi:hypothetical protein
MPGCLRPARKVDLPAAPAITFESGGMEPAADSTLRGFQEPVNSNMVSTVRWEFDSI